MIRTIFEIVADQLYSVKSVSTHFYNNRNRIFFVALWNNNCRMFVLDEERSICIERDLHLDRTVVRKTAR